MKREMDTRRVVRVPGEIEGVKDNGTRRRGRREQIFVLNP
jgi:hypothetical protein